MASNFQVDDVPASSAEAAYVMSQCPSSIVGIEIGNEPDKFGSWESQTTDYESFARCHRRHARGFVGWPGLHQ